MLRRPTGMTSRYREKGSKAVVFSNYTRSRGTGLRNSA